MSIKPICNFCSYFVSKHRQSPNSKHRNYCGENNTDNTQMPNKKTNWDSDVIPLD